LVPAVPGLFEHILHPGKGNLERLQLLFGDVVNGVVGNRVLKDIFETNKNIFHFLK
jgi:hypothetical protein